MKQQYVISNYVRQISHFHLACESIRFSFAIRRWGRLAKRPQRRRAKEKRMLSQANFHHKNVIKLCVRYYCICSKRIFHPPTLL